MSLLDSVKNKTASLALRAFLNQHVSRYAELHEVKVDVVTSSATVILTPMVTKTWKVDVSWVLSGTKLRIRNAAVSQVGGGAEWVHLILQDHLVGKEFDIPTAIAKLL